MRVLLAGSLVLLIASWGVSVYLGFRLAASETEVAVLSEKLAVITRKAHEHASAELAQRRTLLQLQEEVGHRKRELAGMRAVNATMTSEGAVSSELVPPNRVESVQQETFSDVWFCSKAVLSGTGGIRSEDLDSRTLKGRYKGRVVWVKIEEREEGKVRLRVFSETVESAREIRRQIELLLAGNF